MTLKERIEELTARWGTLRAAARAVDIDPGYMSKLRTGDKTEPSEDTLNKLGLRRVVTYERDR